MSTTSTDARTCAFDTCNRPLTAYRSNRIYCSDRHRLAAFKQRRRTGVRRPVIGPSERFPASPRTVDPAGFIAEFAEWLDLLPNYVADHYDPESVVETLLDLAADVLDVLDGYVEALDGRGASVTTDNLHLLVLDLGCRPGTS